MEAKPSEISAEDVIQAGLIGGPVAKRRRERLGDLLKIGYTNGKRLQKRSQMFQIKRSDFIDALDAMRQEEQDEQ